MTARVKLTPREALWRQESEADFQSWVIDFARAHGWLVAHVNDSRRQNVSGLPDLVMARAGVIILAECKTMGGSVRQSQIPWLEASGWHLWRPSHREVIMEILT
jgi:hypothetical protein